MEWTGRVTSSRREDCCGWMASYAQRTGHYSEEQEKELVKFREQLSTLTR